ncbi:MAG: extracellular solute-binding protein [Dehalococcoidia bacterium]|nr:extracellular solute-binding protein [Dehalococcoidia bacterium]
MRRSTGGGHAGGWGQRGVSRRLFLRGTALTTFGLAGAALIGCDDDDEPADGDGTPGGGATTPSGAPSPGGTATGGPPAGGGEIGTADVVGIWGEEVPNFEAMVAPWEDDTGGTMEFVGTRELAALLTTRVEGGNPPDIALPAEVGLFQQFAREGLLVPLSECGVDEEAMGNYPEGFVDLGTVDGELYGYFMKADSKGTIWYNPRLFDEQGWEPLTADSSFDDLVSLSEEIAGAGFTPWSMGVEAAGDSGWPGTDWIQQILLNESGPEVYDGIVDGSVPFTDPAMRSAWESFGQIALTEGWTVQGGGQGINATNFINSTYPPFESEPQAAMVYLGGFAAGFIQEQFPDLVAGEDYDFFPFPGGAITGSANIAYAFNSEETTCSLLMYLATAEAQQVWVDRGGFVSVHQGVSLDAYPDEVSRRQAAQLTEAEVFRFDLDDGIGGDVQQAYFSAVTEYLQDPSQLDALLEQIEAARA